jgi:hypothetical protein
VLQLRRPALHYSSQSPGQPSCGCTAVQHAQADPESLARSRIHPVAVPSTHKPYMCCHLCSDLGLPVHHHYCCCFVAATNPLFVSKAQTTQGTDLSCQLSTTAAAPPAALEKTQTPAQDQAVCTERWRQPAAPVLTKSKFDCTSRMLGECMPHPAANRDRSQHVPPVKTGQENAHPTLPASNSPTVLPSTAQQCCQQQPNSAAINSPTVLPSTAQQCCHQQPYRSA